MINLLFFFLLFFLYNKKRLTIFPIFLRIRAHAYKLFSSSMYRTLHSYKLFWAVCHLFPQRWRTLNVQSRETIGQEDHVICLQLRRRA